MNGNLHRQATFTGLPTGGNPAGVLVGEELPSSDEMQQLAWETGYSETAFMAPVCGRSRRVRYYSPDAKVSFCGHATIAAALGGYFREAGLVDAPATLYIRQGEAMGRPSRLTVGIPVTGCIVVSGTAVSIEK